MPIAGLVVPLISSDPTVMAQAGATPKPGSPGGNHSKPGDNKKKKKADNKKKSNNDSNRGGSSARGSSGESGNQRSGSSFTEQTNANNRWSADGPNRSVNTRISSQADPSQPAQAPSQVQQAPPTQGQQNTAQPPSPPQGTAPAQTATPPAAQQQTPTIVIPAQGEYAPGEQSTTTVNPAAPNDPTGPATALVVGLAAAGAGAASRRNGGATRTTSSDPSQGVRGGFSVTHIGQTDGDQTLVTLTDPSSPTQYDFDATNLTPEGGSLRVNPDQTVSILDASGTATGDGFSAPWARDATGTAQPTQFTAQGSTLTQTITPRPDAVYPITADPDEMEVALDGSGGSTGVRVTPENLATALTSPPTTSTQPPPAQTPAFMPRPQDLAVLRQVMANDGVPAAQMDQQVNQVVAGAAQLNTQIANGTIPQAATAPTEAVYEPGFAENFRETWDAGIEGAQTLFGVAGPGAPGVFESWGNVAQGFVQQVTNPLSPAVDQINSFIAAPNMAYFAGGMSAQLAQQAPLAIFGPETLASRGALGSVTQIGRLDATSQLLTTSETLGGHLLSRHVGLSDAELTARLAENPKMDAASTFGSLEEASAAANAVLEYNAAVIESWVQGGAIGRLQLDAPFNGGLIIMRNTEDVVAGTAARLVLVGDGAGGFRVLTGFPKP
ncbi:hypothetical protein H7J86_20970 [Mycobacterium hackensackense]|uniref:RNase A-like domain-containing protein n=1 Tax=Mycobacterium hackensackense TaxID=228909 RepID=UPI002265F00B|nr:RNase A-like domain-containing protein [Mycobacterium hackensackense]MCV7254639.1 hypothetical protein [Mycobacterium hackensackense]